VGAPLSPKPLRRNPDASDARSGLVEDALRRRRTCCFHRHDEVRPILRVIEDFIVSRIRTGNLWGSRIESTVWLTAASKPVEVPPDPRS
jgi:hypothetical protein